VEVLYGLVYHGICCKLSVPLLSRVPAPEYNGSVKLTLLIFHNPVSTRARHAAKRHHPGEAGVAPPLAARRARNVENPHRLISHNIVKNPEVPLPPPALICHASVTAPCRAISTPARL
jgi:hypothetical protein